MSDSVIRVSDLSKYKMLVICLLNYISADSYTYNIIPIVVNELNTMSALFNVGSVYYGGMRDVRVESNTTIHFSDARASIQSNSFTANGTVYNDWLVPAKIYGIK